MAKSKKPKGRKAPPKKQKPSKKLTPKPVRAPGPSVPSQSPPEPEITHKTPGKADNVTIAQRITEVLRIRLEGAQFHDIVQYAAEKGWAVGDRQLLTYSQRADELLIEQQEKSRKKIFAWHLAKRAALFARAVNAADYRTALAILTDDAKLRRMYPADRLEVKSKTEQPASLFIIEEIVTTFPGPPADAVELEPQPPV